MRCCLSESRAIPVLRRPVQEHVGTNSPIAYLQENDGWPGQSAACPGIRRRSRPGHAATCPATLSQDRGEITTRSQHPARCIQQPPLPLPMLKLNPHIKHQSTSTGDQQRLPQMHLLHQLGRNRERKDQEPQKLKKPSDAPAPHRRRYLVFRAGSIATSPTSVTAPSLTETGIPRPYPLFT